jgi:hypothetical protein
MAMCFLATATLPLPLGKSDVEQQKAQCCLWFYKSKSVTAVQLLVNESLSV